MAVRDRVGLSVAAIRVAGANRRLRLLQVARLLSVTGRWAYTITLAVFAYRVGGAAGVAVAGLVRLAPAALAAPFAGTLIQRLRLGRLLFTGGVLRSAALAGAGVTIAAGGPSSAVYALVAVESGLSVLLRPAQNSLLPALARTPEELTAANLALSMIESGGAFLGPLAGAALLHATGSGVVFIGSAGAYLVSALLIVPIRSDESAAIAAVGRSPANFLVDAAAGMRNVVRRRQSWMIVLIYGAQSAVAGALNVLIVVTALRLLDLQQSGVGTLTAALGVGGVFGGGLVLARLRRRRHGRDLRIGLLLLGAPLLLLALLSSRPAAFVLLGVVGIGVTVVDVAAITLLQRDIEDGLLPHALALVQTMFVVTVAAGTLLAPLLVSLLGVRGALFATGLPLPLLAIGLGGRLRQLDLHARPSSPHVDLLGSIPIFAPLADSALEHLGFALRPLVLGADELVFRQGDRGDDFYVIEDGRVEVVEGGEPVATLGPGEYFGEIALLRDVPRTASIRTLTPVRLLLLERAPFLATVTGNLASADAADAIVSARTGLRASLTAP